MTTVHASPDYRIHATASPPPGYPTGPTADAYTAEPDAGSFEARRVAFLAHCATNPAPENTKVVFYELARLAADGATGSGVHEGAIFAALDFVDARRDCVDFTLHGVLRLLYQFGDHPGLSTGLLERCRQTVLGFKYWPDEPGADSMCTWTENHHILFAGAAYLAGQMFPDAVFVNSGHTGSQKMVVNRPRILRWLDLRFRTGFSEWLSHVYYDEDLTALLALADFCRDPEISARATMVIDLLLLDIALNSYRGVFGSSHGRAYENTKKWASNEGTTDTAKLLFGMGQYSGFDNMSAVAFALSPSYRLPPAIAAIAAGARRLGPPRPGEPAAHGHPPGRGGALGAGCRELRGWHDLPDPGGLSPPAHGGLGHAHVRRVRLVGQRVLRAVQAVSEAAGLAAADGCVAPAGTGAGMGSVPQHARGSQRPAPIARPTIC